MSSKAWPADHPGLGLSKMGPVDEQWVGVAKGTHVPTPTGAEEARYELRRSLWGA